MSDDGGRDRKLRKRYGITLAQYEERLSEQGYRCAICDVDQAKCSQRFAVDHCHETGKVRALLCMHCNIGLGHFHDKPERLRKAAEYLDKHSNEEV